MSILYCRKGARKRGGEPDLHTRRDHFCLAPLRPLFPNSCAWDGFACSAMKGFCWGQLCSVSFSFTVLTAGKQNPLHAPSCSGQKGRTDLKEGLGQAFRNHEADVSKNETKLGLRAVKEGAGSLEYLEPATSLENIVISLPCSAT